MKTGLQALANFTTGSPAGCGAVWQALCPAALLSLAQQPSGVGTCALNSRDGDGLGRQASCHHRKQCRVVHADLHELLGCIVYRCTEASTDAHADLLSAGGMDLLVTMGTHAQQVRGFLFGCQARSSKRSLLPTTQGAMLCVHA